MALRTGISIIAGSSAFIALGFVLSRWRARRLGLTRASDDALSNGSPSTNVTVTPTSSPRGSVPVQVVPAVAVVDTELAVDGGVSARPAEQWRDSVGAYDAANPDDLGAEFLARAVQVPRDLDDVGSDLDANGLHVDVLGEDELPSEALPGSWGLRDEDVAELSTAALDAESPDEEVSPGDSSNAVEYEHREPDVDEETVTPAESEQWYAGLREQSWRAARRG